VYDFGNNHSHMPGTCHAAQSPSEQKPEKKRSISVFKNEQNNSYTIQLEN